MSVELRWRRVGIHVNGGKTELTVLVQLESKIQKDSLVSQLNDLIKYQISSSGFFATQLNSLSFCEVNLSKHSLTSVTLTTRAG